MKRLSAPTSVISRSIRILPKQCVISYMNHGCWDDTNMIITILLTSVPPAWSLRSNDFPIVLWGVIGLISRKRMRSYQWKKKRKHSVWSQKQRICVAGSSVIERLNVALSLSVVLNLRPVPEVCCSLRRPMKEYWLFVIGSVTKECTRQQMRNRKKMLWGLKCHVNSWVQPLNTSGVLSTPFNAFKGQGFVWTGLCSHSLLHCEWPQFPATIMGGSEFMEVKLSTRLLGRGVQLNWWKHVGEAAQRAQIQRQMSIRRVISWTGQKIVLVSACKIKSVYSKITLVYMHYI